ncbi:MAG TPA: hypothetical protein VG735_07805 [Caulobacterales bacterium]|nr:hypothetical protein [Caulobacterales bacterium]
MTARGYATKAASKRIGECARAAGIEPHAMVFRPDGTVIVLDAAAANDMALAEDGDLEAGYEQWEKGETARRARSGKAAAGKT